MTEEERQLVASGQQAEQQKEGAMRFKKAAEDDYAKMFNNPERFISEKLARLHRTSRRVKGKTRGNLRNRE